MSDSSGIHFETCQANEFLMLRSFIRTLDGFVPRSAARRVLWIQPDAEPGKVLALLEGYEVLYSDAGSSGEELALRRDGHVLGLELRGGHAVIRVLSERFDARPLADGIVARLEPLRLQNREDDGVWAGFSYVCGDRVVRTTQFLRCPSWEDIRANYAPPARDEIDRLLGMPKPWAPGRLVIWHGPPGTGKTYAVRALMMKWKDRFDFLVVTDPERLAADPAYFFRVAGSVHESPHRPWTEAGPGDEPEEGDGKRRVLFILEDTADLILQESRAAHFDKIGKLLNMTDGLFGQGREDLFLVTFNEEVDRIDPAFLRPGRCVANVEFPRFRPASAAAWLREHGHPDAAPAGEMSLAEMYAKLQPAKGEAPAAPARPRRLGFSA